MGRPGGGPDLPRLGAAPAFDARLRAGKDGDPRPTTKGRSGSPTSSSRAAAGAARSSPRRWSRSPSERPPYPASASSPSASTRSTTRPRSSPSTGESSAPTRRAGRFLHGERPVIRALIKDGFKLAIEDGVADSVEPILHSTRFVLVDGEGTIRGYYDGMEQPPVDQLEKDARALAAALKEPTVSFADLPTVNALLNGTAATLLVAGFLLIRSGRREAHRRVMTSAFACSILFLVSYLVYHAEVGSVRFQGTGTVRTVYLSILLTHTVLAAAVPFLAVATHRPRAQGAVREPPPARAGHPPRLALRLGHGRRHLPHALPHELLTRARRRGRQAPSAPERSARRRARRGARGGRLADDLRHRLDPLGEPVDAHPLVHAVDPRRVVVVHAKRERPRTPRIPRERKTRFSDSPGPRTGATTAPGKRLARTRRSTA